MPLRTPRRGPTLTRSYASNACTTMSSSPQGRSRKVLVDNEELLARIYKARSAVALKNALTAPVESWDSTKHASSIRLGSGYGRETFELSSRTSGVNGEDYEVLAIGCIACCPQELVSILSPPDEGEYNAAMKGLYGRKFIYGSVVQTLNANHLNGSMSDGDRLTVRTGCFTRSRMLAHNEQWCYLDYFQPTSDSVTDSMSSPDTSQGFSVTLLSLSEHELAMGKAVGGLVDQIDGVTVLLVVDTVPAVSKDVSDGKLTKLRVMFHALYKGNQKLVAGHVSDKMARARLVALAEGIPRLPAVVRRRRLGVQVFAKQSVDVPMPKADAQNWRCISCTKGLRMTALIFRTRRCQLCAYNVCAACWSSENIEASNGLVVTMGVCNRCLEWVDCCDYSNIQSGRGGTVQIVEELERSKVSLTRPPVGQSLRDDLAAESTKEAAVTVIKMLLNRSKTATNATCSSFAESTGIDADDEATYMSAVEEYFQRRASEAPSAADCKLANAKQRTYPLHPKDPGSPSAPMPDNEAARQECIDKFKFMDIKDPMLELDIICSFLSKELGFFCTMITIVGATHQLVLSCTIRELVQAMLPREHTFCQHLLMGDAPFIIQNPEADIRFYNLNPVTLQGIKYYCGIPITGPNGLLVGSICCVHTSAMDITRLQYDTLVRFGEIASKIIRVKAESKLQSL